MKKFTIFSVLLLIIGGSIYYFQIIKEGVISDPSIPSQTSPSEDAKNANEISYDSSDALIKYRLMVDINGDGLTDKLLSDSTRDNGKAGLMWSVYLNKGDGVYEEFDSLVTAHPLAVAYGVLPSGTGGEIKTLVTYHRSNAMSGSLVSYLIENDELFTSVMHIDFLGQGKETYDQYFKNSNLKVEIDK